MHIHFLCGCHASSVILIQYGTVHIMQSKLPKSAVQVPNEILYLLNLLKASEHGQGSENECLMFWQTSPFALHKSIRTLVNYLCLLGPLQASINLGCRVLTYKEETISLCLLRMVERITVNAKIEIVQF